jgi:ribonuclease HII
VSPPPTLRTERSLLRQGVPVLACVDEVGRGALAGPVSVGVTLVDLTTGSAPKGLRDSKLLSPEARAALLPRLARWPLASAVGHAEPDEVDEVGILAALRVAAARAFSQVDPVDHALLDGSHDWLTVPSDPDALVPHPRDCAAAAMVDLGRLPGTVVTKVRADMTCAGVAAASVLAKCARDAIMVALDPAHPEYRWAANKGYAAPEHIEALRRTGPSVLHRRSWRLPGIQWPVPGGAAAVPAQASAVARPGGCSAGQPGAGRATPVAPG